jgi:hypothetical protein
MVLVVLVLFCTNLGQAGDLGLKPETGKFRWAQDDWRTTDKLTHALFYSWLAREWTDILKNKWAGAGISLGVGILNEVKDAYYPWETHGMAGGDGWSWWDLGADCVGIGWTLWFPEDPTIRNGIYCARPLKELWPKVETAVVIGVSWVGLCMSYNFLVEGEAFPNHSGEWVKIPGKQGGVQHVLSDFNGEVSFIGPWWMNAHLRPYMHLGWRVLGITATLVAWEEMNGYLRSGDVPFWGANGFRDGDIGVGALSLTGVIVYEVLFFPNSAVCTPSYSVGPTPQGLGLTFSW